MKNIRMLVVGMFAGAILATAGSAYGAAAIEKVTALVRSDYSVKVDGEKVSMKNAPLTYNGTTYIPLREAGEILGYDVGFNAGTITLDQPYKGEATLTETTTTNNEPTTGTTTEQIDLSNWVPIGDVKKAGVNLDIGIPEGESKDSVNRQYVFSKGNLTVVFVVPRSIFEPYKAASTDGELLFYKSDIWIDKALANKLTAQ